MRKKIYGYLTVLSLALLSFTGCSTIGLSSSEEETKEEPIELGIQAEAEPVTVKGSGFLGDYSQFKPSTEEENLFVYYRDGTGRVFRSYDGIIIEDVFIYLQVDDGILGVKPADLSMLVDGFESTLRDEVKSSGYNIVNGPDAGVMDIRIALTGVMPLDIMKDASSYKEEGNVIQGTHLNLENIALEVEFVDSRTGERQVAYVDQNLGREIDAIGGITTWAHVKTAFDNWAKKFKLRLDEMRQ